MARSPLVRALHWLVTNWLVTDSNLVAPENRHTNFEAVLDHVFLCGGRLRIVRRRPLSLLPFVLLVVLGVVYWCKEASWFWHTVSPAAVVVFTYLMVLTVLFLVKAATSDPGYVPKNVHMPHSAGSTLPVPAEYFNTISLPYFSDAVHGVTVKYCPTCHVWRSPRMSHCGVCNMCVQNHDHHCIFLNNCVGYRNYRFFLWFLLGAVVCSAMVSIMGFVHVFHYRMVPSKITCFSTSISKHPAAFFLAIAGLAAFVYPAMLLALHIFLTSMNCTTREYLNYIRHNSDYNNVFDLGSIWRNLWMNWCASPAGVNYTFMRRAYNDDDVRFADIPVYDVH